ncbi:hypothetical protein ABIE89_007704 [Bradyrhizobium niftali]|uniref:hypothetical protein n=1 Tax=Bradyrhizobium niftali TaxID=2560055 RepID=UPI003833B376
MRLIWILDYLRAEPYMAERLKLRLVDFDLLGADVAGLRERTVRALDVTERDFGVARMAWEAYRAPTPELCFGLLSRDFPGLPFLKPAPEQLLAELPSPTTGLGATEARLLELIAKGHNRTKELFQPGGLLETRVFDQWELGPCLKGSRPVRCRRSAALIPSSRRSLRTMRAAATPLFAGAGCC